VADRPEPGDSFDQVFGVTIPLLRDLKSQAPQAVCTVFPATLPRTLLVNRTAPYRRGAWPLGHLRHPDWDCRHP
jgi:hypothetical protein